MQHLQDAHAHMDNIMILIPHYVIQFLNAHKNRSMILNKGDVYQKQEIHSSVLMVNIIIIKLVNVNQFRTVLKA